MIKKSLSIFCVYLMLVGCTSAAAQAPDTTPPTTTTLPPTSGDETAPVAETTPEPADVNVVPPLMSPPSGDERLYGISLGMPAPFDGVILNESAAAWLESEADAVQERCQLFVTRRVGELTARLTAETDRLELRISTMEEVHGIELRAREAQIEALMRLNEAARNSGPQWWEQALWIGGALIVGLGAGILIGFLGTN